MNNFVKFLPNSDILVIDEMPINLHNLIPKKIWELKGKKSLVPSCT